VTYDGLSHLSSLSATVVGTLDFLNIYSYDAAGNVMSARHIYRGHDESTRVRIAFRIGWQIFSQASTILSKSA
jgi:hypothetical protein